MPRVTMQSFHTMDAEASRSLLLKRFPWIIRYRSTVDAALSLQTGMVPRPDGYFQWHLPRIVLTLETLLLPACRAFASPRVLVIGSWPAFTQLFRQIIRMNGIDAKLTATSLDGAPETFELAGQAVSFPTAKLTIGQDAFPWPDSHFDVVVFTEMVEHLTNHPQYALAEMNRILDRNGRFVVTTPNVVAWKKIYAASQGKWDFDSPTFGGGWGHRYEYSNYQVHCMLEACGFEPIVRATRDIYFDDPRGVRQAAQKWLFIATKCLTLDLRSGAKLARSSGSTLFFLYQKRQAIDRQAMHIVRI